MQPKYLKRNRLGYNMKYHTLRTVLAKVAKRTVTSIVIYFINTSCIVFTRIRVAVVDI